jgi:hypothetical protein
MEIGVRFPDMIAYEVVKEDPSWSIATKIVRGLSSSSQTRPEIGGMVRREAEHSMCRHYVALKGDAEYELMRSKEHGLRSTASI